MARLINISNKKGRLDCLSSTISLKTNKKMTKEEIEEERKLNEGEVFVTAVLGYRQYTMVKNGEATLEVPYGVEMQNDAGSKVLNFRCDDLLVAKELVDGLDASGIVWQEDFEVEDVKV